MSAATQPPQADTQASIAPEISTPEHLDTSETAAVTQNQQIDGVAETLTTESVSAPIADAVTTSQHGTVDDADTKQERLPSESDVNNAAGEVVAAHENPTFSENTVLEQAQVTAPMPDAMADDKRDVVSATVAEQANVAEIEPPMAETKPHANDFDSKPDFVDALQEQKAPPHQLSTQPSSTNQDALTAFMTLRELITQNDAQALAEQWILFIEELDLSQHALNMVNCCAVTAVTDGVLQLAMPEVQDVWHSQENIDELNQALAHTLGAQSVSVAISLVQDTQQPLNTPMAMMQQKERAKELAAEQAIANDVDVQYFLKQMGGKIVPHSVKPLAADEPFYNE